MENEKTPCDLCRFGRNSAQCVFCPHNPPMPPHMILAALGCLGVFIVLSAFLLSLFEH